MAGKDHATAAAEPRSSDELHLLSALSIANDPKDLGPVQRHYRAMLDGFVERGTAPVSLTSDELYGGLEFEVRLDPADGVVRVKGIKGTPLAWFTLSLAFALASDHGVRVRRCPDETCRRYFIRTGKMEFCSRRCSRRVYMRGVRREEREIIRAHRARKGKRGAR